MGWSKKKKIIVGAVAFVVSGGIIFAIFYQFALKPVPIKTAQDGDSPQKVVDNANIDGFDGSVIISSSFRLSDATNITYYLSISGAEYPVDATPPIDLLFAEVYNTTSNIFTKTRLLTTESAATIVVADVQSLTFPHRLPSAYNPDTYNGGIFTDASNLTLGNVGFAGPVPQPIPSPTPSTTLSVLPSVASSRTPSHQPSLTTQPSTSPSTSQPSTSPSTSSAPSPSSPGPSLEPSAPRPSAKPSAKPTVRPTFVPTALPTPPPTPPPTPSPSNPKISEVTDIVSLSSQLSGGSYNIRGTITLEIIQRFINGAIVSKPSLTFQNIESPSAPDAILYLSKDTGRDVNGAITIWIEGTDGRRFAKNGNFVQDLEDDIDLEEYRNGSFVVWCRRFSVYLGGGNIIANF